MTISPGTKLGRYEIRSKLGEGGMGEVYLARDTSELDRTVAIKLLPAEVAADPKRMKRFVQEARTVSALNHPNVLTIHEFGQHGDTRFIATEYVEGVTLREHLRAHHLKLHEVLEIATQVAAALDAAHEAHVVHRDIKPDNIMVRRRDHIVKVLDFGLAKPVENLASGVDTEAGTKLKVNTEPGVVMGTVAYMSPEQSEGSASIDHRSDIWSLGVVLYEMITGRVPFDGKDVHRQVIAIRDEAPAPLYRFTEGVPERLEDIVTKSLAKDPGERYQTAKDLLIDLRNLKRKLEVDAEIDRTLAPEARAAAATAGDQSISPTASQAGTTITNALRYTHASAIQLSYFQLYLKGQFYLNKRTVNDLQKAIECFRQATTLAPSYALAFAGLADANSLISVYGGASQRDAMPKAKEAALKALSLDNNLAEAHASLGQILDYYDYDFVGAEREYNRAIELKPNYATAHHWRGEVLCEQARFEESFDEYRRALEIDPLSLIINRMYGHTLLYARQYDAAIAQLRKTIELDASFPSAHFTLALAYEVKGNHAECVEEFAKLHELNGEPQKGALVRDNYAKGGWQTFLKTMTGEGKLSNSSSYNAATFYVALGEKDKALAELNKSYENREPSMRSLKIDPLLDPLRDDPEFVDLMRRMGLRQ